jgi:hypothetical protein
MLKGPMTFQTYPPGEMSVVRHENGTISLVFSEDGKEKFTASMPPQEAKGLTAMILTLIDLEMPE